MSIEDYKMSLESMSKEELLNEISNLIVDNGIQLQNKNIEMQELRSALARADLQLQFQIGEVDLNNREIERLTEELGEKNTYEEKLNSMIDNLRDDISEQKVEIERLKKELANERNAVITFQESANAHRLKVSEVIKQNADLQKQVEELKIALKNVIESNEVLIEECEQSVKSTAKEILQEIVKLRKEEHGMYYSAYDYAIEIGKRVRNKYGVDGE